MQHVGAVYVCNSYHGSNKAPILCWVTWLRDERIFSTFLLSPTFGRKVTWLAFIIAVRKTICCQHHCFDNLHIASATANVARNGLAYIAPVGSGVSASNASAAAPFPVCNNRIEGRAPRKGVLHNAEFARTPRSPPTPLCCYLLFISLLQAQGMIGSHCLQLTRCMHRKHHAHIREGALRSNIPDEVQECEARFYFSCNFLPLTSIET